MVFQKYDFDFLFTCGYTKAISQITVNDIDQLVKTVWLHYVHYHPLAELIQLRKGIRDTLGLDNFMSMHPDCFWKLLVSSDFFSVTPAYLSDIFVIQYSDNGSNNRTKEEAIMFFWFEYISECQGTCIIYAKSACMLSCSLIILHIASIILVIIAIPGPGYVNKKLDVF